MKKMVKQKQKRRFYSAERRFLGAENRVSGPAVRAFVPLGMKTGPHRWFRRSGPSRSS